MGTFAEKGLAKIKEIVEKEKAPFKEAVEKGLAKIKEIVEKGGTKDSKAKESQNSGKYNAKKRNVKQDGDIQMQKKPDDIQTQPSQEEYSRDINTIYEEKNQMEREISRIVAGDTGLTEVLKIMKDEAEKRDGKGFLFYAWTYRRKAAELEKTIEKAKERHVYELLTPKEQVFYARLLHAVDIMDRFGMSDTEAVSEEALGQWYDAVKKEEE